MSERQSVENPSSDRRPAYWITLARSVLATVLGLALILQPDKARPMLVNFIGVFWLAAGIMSLRWGANGERARRLSVVVGVVGIVAGLLILGRFLLIQFVGEAPMVLLLGSHYRADGPGSRFRWIPYGAIGSAAFVDQHAVGRFRDRAWAWWCCCGVMTSARSFTPL